MNKPSPIRVRFAPSPTGTMHLGNVRTALLNYLFAQKNQGIFVLRIEDTDADRNFDPQAKQIMQDLQWLGLTYGEGGLVGGPYGPYYQSERSHLYQEQLDILKNKDALYRCFCTPEELERKRARSMALKIAPRYDRTCFKLTEQEVQKRVQEGILFIWRFKIPENTTVTVKDLAHGNLTFDLNHFSDFPLTRSDGSFTFIFANCVDDILMKMTHILRGEDHLSNTANQMILYQTFGVEAPFFWHLPILCNVSGKKLSKRDFGFSLQDLKQGGYLPEALINYLAIIGGSFAHEIMDLPELIQAMNFDSIKPISNIRYDVEKLKWVNHKWIQRYDPEKLTDLVLVPLQTAYPAIQNLDRKQVIALVQTMRSELSTLLDIVPMLNFYFEEPLVTQEALQEHIPQASKQQFMAILEKNLIHLDNFDAFLDALKKETKDVGISPKMLYTVLRLALTGSAHGPALKDILSLLGAEVAQKRLEKIIS